MGQNFDELVEKAIKDVKEHKEVAFDIGSLALMNNEKKNAEAVASYLLEVGLYEQYNGLLKNCKLLSINKEFERVKANNSPSAYLAIVQFLSDEDYETAKAEIFARGSDYDKLKFILADKRTNKVELIGKMINCKNMNVLGYLIKYLSDEDFAKFSGSAGFLSFAEVVCKRGNTFTKSELRKKQDRIINLMMQTDFSNKVYGRCSV